MSRLTTCKDDIYFPNSKESAYTDIVRKLGKLEDIEEELGIDLFKVSRYLELLDIIKRSIYSRESHKYVLNEKLKGQKFMNVSLYISGDTDYNKIKEWLEND